MVAGIDVSDFQDVASFHAVQNGGFGFIVCKATQGTNNVQATFADYRDRARSIDLIFGAYHFLSWVSDPAAQAEHFLATYSPKAGDLTPMLDCESCAASSTVAIAQMSGFLTAVEDKIAAAGLTYQDGSRARMLLYMSLSFPGDHLGGGSAFSGHPAWVAAYNNDPFETNIPAAWIGKKPGAKFWQYSDDITVPGIPGGVDGDRFMGTLDELKAFTLK